MIEISPAPFLSGSRADKYHLSPFGWEGRPHAEMPRRFRQEADLHLQSVTFAHNIQYPSCFGSEARKMRKSLSIYSTTMTNVFMFFTSSPVPEIESEILFPGWYPGR